MSAPLATFVRILISILRDRAAKRNPAN